jgi:HemK-related putative methylase
MKNLDWWLSVMADLPMSSLLTKSRPGRLALLLGKIQKAIYKLAGKYRYDDFRVERVLGVPIIVTPSVANPKLLRTGAFLASQLTGELISSDDDVLDLGTGSGICALVAARHARRVVGTDINPAAVRCARINSLMNLLEEKIDLRHGDLFDTVAGERFDFVLFNPPFLAGVPKDNRDAAWRSGNVAAQFAAGLGDHLKPGGAALLLLSSFGDAGSIFEAELRSRNFRLEILARRHFYNELIIILRVTPPRLQCERLA